MSGGGFLGRRARRAVSKLVEELKTEGLVILGKPDVPIRNAAASADLGYRIDLEDTANNLQRTIYEPDQFPGLIYSMKEPKVVMLAFASPCVQALVAKLMRKEL